MSKNNVIELAGRDERQDPLADAEQAFDLFIATDDAKYPKATLCLHKDWEELMAFYDFPAQHWQSIRTSNPIESVFGTIRHRTKRSKGCLSRDGMLHKMSKLGMCAQKNWHGETLRPHCYRQQPLPAGEQYILSTNVRSIELFELRGVKSALSGQ